LPSITSWSCFHALAFLGNAPLLAIVLGVGGIAILLATFAILG
jgi:hypothetical protein